MATSECEAALTCDYGQVPAVCASSQSGQVPPPDAAAGPDAAAMGVDAGPRPVDAALPVVDAAPPPDAALDAALDAAPDAAPAT